MSKKPTKLGIKVWVAADSLTGYVWNFHLYTGKMSITYTYIIHLIYRKNNKMHLQNTAHNVVMSVLSGLKNKGFHIYVDNFYTSPTLFSDFHSHGLV